jgi:hypothetical protein
MKVSVDLTDDELYRLHLWIAPQVYAIARRGSTIALSLRYDAQIAYKVWKAWQDEHPDEQDNTSATEERLDQPGP